MKMEANCSSIWPALNNYTDANYNYILHNNNCSSSINTLNGVERQYEQDANLKFITLAFYMLTFVFGLIGNSLVIYIICHFWKIRVKSVANYYIWNLAVADELFILALPIFCWATFTDKWPIPGIMGTISCKLAYVIRDINKFSSIFLLVALSVDRYLASFHNLGSFRTIRVGKWVCFVIWIACIVIATPYLLYAQTIVTKHGTTSCRLNWPHHPIKHGFPYLRFWTYFQLVVGLSVPAVIILTSYALLYHRLRNIQLRHEHDTTVKRPSKKMTQTVFVIVVTFILCQTPYHILQIIAQGRIEKAQRFAARGDQYLPPQSEITTYVYLNLVSQILIFVSSCCNPIIYGLLNPNYRRLYSEVLCKCKRECETEIVRCNKNAENPDQLEKIPVRIRFEINFHLPCDTYYWRRFWRWRKRADSQEKCIELDKADDFQDIAQDDITEWQSSIAVPGTSLMTL